MSDTAPVSSPSNPDDDLQKELDKKKEDLKTTQDEIATRNQTITDLQVEIRTLQSKIADLQQTIGGYDKTSATLEKQFEDASREVDEKATVAGAAVKDVKTQIENKIADFDKSLNDQEEASKKAGDKAQAAVKDGQDADANAQKKQADYDAVKKTPKDAEAALRDLAALLEQIRRYESQKDYVAMYFLVTEAKKLADTIHIPSLSDYTKTVRTAQDDAENTKKEATDKRKKADDLFAEYTKLRTASDAAKKSRRADLLVILKVLKPKAA
jgi:DNA repair exonuclease SbcCD ATPase subunit